MPASRPEELVHAEELMYEAKFEEALDINIKKLEFVIGIGVQKIFHILVQHLYYQRYQLGIESYYFEK